MKRHKTLLKLTDYELYMVVTGLQWLGIDGMELAEAIEKEFKDKYYRGREIANDKVKSPTK